MPQMTAAEKDALRTEIYDLLYELGITVNHQGFLYISGAVYFCMEQPELLRTFSRDIYPKLIKTYHADPNTIEDRVQKIIQGVWYKHSDRLIRMSGHTLQHRPPPAQFIRILCEYLTRRHADGSPEDSPTF